MFPSAAHVWHKVSQGLHSCGFTPLSGQNFVGHVGEHLAPLVTPPVVKLFHQKWSTPPTPPTPPYVLTQSQQ